MKKHCVFALPLLLAGCGDDLPRYQGRVDFDLVRLAPSRLGHLPEITGTQSKVVNTVQTLARLESPVKIAPRQQVASRTHELGTHKHHGDICVIRTQLAQAESRRQSGERQLRRLNDIRWRRFVSQRELDQQRTIIRTEAAHVAELRAALKSARFTTRTTQHHAPSQTAFTEHHTLQDA